MLLIRESGTSCDCYDRNQLTHSVFLDVVGDFQPALGELKRQKFHGPVISPPSLSLFCRRYWETTGLVTGGQYNSHQGCQPYLVKACDHHVVGKWIHLID